MLHVNQSIVRQSYNKTSPKNLIEHTKTYFTQTLNDREQYKRFYPGFALCCLYQGHIHIPMSDCSASIDFDFNTFLCVCRSCTSLCIYFCVCLWINDRMPPIFCDLQFSSGGKSLYDHMCPLYVFKVSRFYADKART